MDKTTVLKSIKEYSLITLGLLVMTFGLSFFLEPAELAVGGVFGFAMLVKQLVPALNVGDIMLVMNIFLFIIAFIIIGKDFGARTIYASLVLSFLVGRVGSLFQITKPLTDDVFLNLFFGILVQGMGMAIIFYYGASTGGTDIVAKIINKFTHMDIGKALLLSDILIVFAACFIFGAEKGLYAMLGVIMNGFVIDNMIEGLNSKINISIISEKMDEIKAYVISTLDRGATIYEAKGAYTDENRPVMHTVMSKKEFILLKKYVRKIDPNAFVIAYNVKEVMGEGFRAEH